MGLHILVEKVLARIRAYSARYLSYGGRLTLVQTFLSKLHIFWSRIFLIQKSILRQIDAICTNYLWNGSMHYINSPLVSWKDVCKPKEEGGLGLIDIEVWNVASIAKYEWWLATKADHPWVKCVNAMYLRGQNSGSILLQLM